MKIQNFIARQFRNLSEVELECAPALNILIGNNAQGKTNIIEGLSVLSTLSSFRHAKNAQLIQMGCEEAQLEATVLKAAKPNALTLRLSGSRRQCSMNGKSVEPGKYITYLKTTIFSPESLLAIKSGPEARRELIDEAVFQTSPAAAKNQWEFNKALRQRNALLKQLKNEQISLSYARELLEALDILYIDAASRITHDRVLFIRQIVPYIEQALAQIVGDPQLKLGLEYVSSSGSWLSTTGLEEIRQRFLAVVGDEKRRRAEEALGLTLTGPHRHEIKFLVNGNDSRIYASQGQQRALILSFKIAEIVYHGKTFGSFPVLLLDDVMSELDEKKRNYLIEFLRTNEAQTFVTTTDLNSVELLKHGRCAVFRVEHGRITRGENGDN